MAFRNADILKAAVDDRRLRIQRLGDLRRDQIEFNRGEVGAGRERPRRQAKEVASAHGGLDDVATAKP